MTYASTSSGSWRFALDGNLGSERAVFTCLFVFSWFYWFISWLISTAGRWLQHCVCTVNISILIRWTIEYDIQIQKRYATISFFISTTNTKTHWSQSIELKSILYSFCFLLLPKYLIGTSLKLVAKSLRWKMFSYSHYIIVFCNRRKNDLINSHDFVKTNTILVKSTKQKRIFISTHQPRAKTECDLAAGLDAGLCPAHRALRYANSCRLHNTAHAGPRGQEPKQ